MLNVTPVQLTEGGYDNIDVAAWCWNGRDGVVADEFMDRLYTSSPHTASSHKSHLSGSLRWLCLSICLLFVQFVPTLYGVTVKSGISSRF